MTDEHIGCLCVVRDGVLSGILTERDIVARVAGPRRDPKTLKVEEVMTPDPEYLLSDDTVAFALNRMHVGGFRHVPLIDKQGKPTGVISVKDIVSHLARSFEQGGGEQQS
jgi:CBS domain-containing protein